MMSGRGMPVAVGADDGRTAGQVLPASFRDVNEACTRFLNRFNIKGDWKRDSQSDLGRREKLRAEAKKRAAEFAREEKKKRKN